MEKHLYVERENRRIGEYGNKKCKEIQILGIHIKN